MSADNSDTDADQDHTSDGTTIPNEIPVGEEGRASAAAARRGRSLATLLAIKNGNDIPDLDSEEAASIGALLSGAGASGGTPAGNTTALNANATSGAPGASPFTAQTALRPGAHGRSNYGQSPDGTRNYLENFNYPVPGEIDAADYQDRADRQDPAFTITYRPVSTTWRYPPRIHDDGTEEDADPTAFEADLQTLFDTLPHGRGLPQYWEWVDRKQRPCNYGILLLGLDDGESLDQPVAQENLSDVSDLRYCNTFSQADVSSWATAGEFPPDDPIREGVVRPDQPVLYEIEFDRPTADGGVETDVQEVHHSRIIHVVEEPTTSEYIGRSCLERHINRLIDYEKVMGASAEAHYASVDRKFVVNADDDSSIPGSDRSQDMELFDQQFKEMLNDMRTAMYTENSDIEVIGGEPVDPSGMIDQLYSAFAGPSGMPQRIMTGSERGDLASTQDRYNYLEGIAERQEQFATGSVVRPTIQRLIEFGVVEAPIHTDNEFTVVFPGLFSLTELERADLQTKRAKALKDLEAAIAAGADRETAYDYAGIPRPDGDSGTTGSGEALDAANWLELDEQNDHVQDAVTFAEEGS